ncbi:HNH endonuclease signature motif containing protein [Mycetocola sp.]|uniref:HNH endonuclease signature motif containing protein n=1 Tax=Mycetocola sp. TaxID=1871042 RepID=UPI0026194292|nr:HNH endonuclease signature motif containing protein [Mycetocola sp.]MCU1559880.1 hypothetical protein [Mycetocola sp.]
MNPAVSAPTPALEAPEEDAVLDGVLAQLADAIEVLDLEHLDRFPANTVLSVLSKTAALNRGVEAILTAISDQVAVRSDPVLGGEGLAARLNYARPSLLIEQVAGVSAATASTWVRVGARTSPRLRVGQTLPPLFPHVADALRDGSIGVDTAEAITRELSAAAPRAEVEHLDAAERILVGQATGASDSHGVPLPPDLVALQARQWRDRLDENGIEPRAEKAFQDRDFWIARTVRNGVLKFGGQVTPDVGGKLHALFDAVLSPRTASRYVPDDSAPETDSGAADVTGDTALDIPDETVSSGPGSASTTDPASQASSSSMQGQLRETRTPGQQRADVFAAMIDSLARSTDAPTVSGASPTVIVRVTADVLTARKGTGQIVGIAGPIPASTIQQILCDSSLIPAYLKPDGGLLALGNEKRAFAREQRLAMIARDGPTCTIDDCQIPASGCEAHHIIEYQDGGPTHLDNGALFCWFHHHMIDTGIFTVTMENGKPKVTVPDWILRRPYFH